MRWRGFVDSIIMMKKGKIIDRGTCKEIIKKHGRNNLEETFLKLARSRDELHKIYALGLRHIYLISNSLPRIIDLIYWPTVHRFFFWGFISKFFTLSSDYYSNTVGIILTAAILYDFLFRVSISFNMMFLEEISVEILQICL